METPISVFFVEDDALDRKAFERFVRKEHLPYHCTFVSSLTEAKEILNKKHHFNIAILDHNLGGESSQELIPYLHGFPYVIVTGEGNEDVAVQSMKEGASDYIVKDPEQGHLKLLPLIIKNVLKQWQLQQHADFFTVISHELRTPLAIQKGAIDNLMDGLVGPLSEPQRQLIQMVQESQGRLEFMVGNMLTITELNKEELHATFKEIQTSPLLTEVLTEFEPIAKKSGITLIGNIAAPLPSILAEENLVKQALQQLLNNAIRFARKEVRIAAELWAADGEKYLRISVSDDGPGISPANQRIIFEPFSQADRPAGGGGYQGIGLGLTICRLIMDKLKGTIQVESTPDAGSTFYILLPQFHSHPSSI